LTRFTVPCAALAALLLACTALRADPPGSAPATTEQIQKAIKDSESAQANGDIAWVLVSTGLVMLMVPGLALFYGGMARRKNVLGTMMQSMVALGLIGIQWLLFGYCLAFGPTHGGVIGWASDLLGLRVLSNLQVGDSIPVFANTRIPLPVHCMYQGMFAIITPALISGAMAERIRFGPYCLFILLWATLVYDPLAHWVWALNDKGEPVGWLGRLGALDFAGGTVVHIAAGLSGLAAILVLRKRAGYPEHAMHPNSMVLTLLGAGMLWFGWFGFNGGSALASNGLAGSALTATRVAAAAAGLGWVLVEWRHKGKPTALGFASGVVAGLVAVTPASGFVSPLSALVIGLAAGVVCYGAVCLKPRLGYDDSLDAFGVHGVGGFLGALLTGVFASAALYKVGSGSDLPAATLGGAEVPRVLVQLLAAGVAAVFSFTVTLGLVKGIDLVFGFCVDADAEREGLDRCEHGEAGFDFGLAMEAAPEAQAAEPRPATVPPDGLDRFTVVLDGADPQEVLRLWNSYFQAGPPPPEFEAVYPYLTTVQNNRFRFRGGDPDKITSSLTRLFQDRLNGAPLHAHVEA
jgi:ammonium transporter, Amt family